MLLPSTNCSAAQRKEIKITKQTNSVMLVNYIYVHKILFHCTTLYTLAVLYPQSKRVKGHRITHVQLSLHQFWNPSNIRDRSWKPCFASHNRVLSAKLGVDSRSKLSSRFHPHHSRLFFKSNIKHWSHHRTFTHRVQSWISRRTGWRVRQQPRVKHRSRRRNKRSILSDGTELLRRVSEETDFPAAAGSVVAELGPITRRVKPAFEDAVSEVTGVTSVAVTFAEFRARGGWVVILARVSPASLLGRVGVGAFRPVMWPATWAASDFELEHSEMIGGENMMDIGNEGERRGCSSMIRVSCVPLRNLKVWDHRYGETKRLRVRRMGLLNWGWVFIGTRSKISKVFIMCARDLTSS